MNPPASLDAKYFGQGQCQFRIWASFVDEVVVHLVEPCSLYFYRLGGDQDYPDPASRCQPWGVHEPYQAIETEFPWCDSDWTGIFLKAYIIYELHVGTFPADGTFEAIIPIFRIWLTWGSPRLS